jgi:hypothetical protein
MPKSVSISENQIYMQINRAKTIMQSIKISKMQAIRRFAKAMRDKCRSPRHQAFNESAKTKMVEEIDLAIRSSCIVKIAQMQLLELWNRSKPQSGRRYDLSELEFRAFSQNGEDGILLYLFSRIGISNKKVVEDLCRRRHPMQLRQPDNSPWMAGLVV